MVWTASLDGRATGWRGDEDGGSAMSFCGMSTPASKRYQRRVMGTMSLYVVVLLAASWIVKHEHLHGWVLYAIAVVPALPILAMLGSMGVYLQEEKDEYVRLMTMRSLVAGTGVLLMVIVVSDFLRAISGAPPLAPFASWVTFFLAFGVAQGVQKMRNRVRDDA
jgi:hypothetical protein